MPDELIALAKKHQITLKFWDFQPPIEAIYYCYPGKNPVIGLDYRITEDKKHFRCVLAEELGHYFTTRHTSNIIHYRYRNRLGMYRAEYQAMVWAVNFLIPDHELEEGYKLMPPWELKDFFQVDPEFMAFKLRLSKDKLLNYVNHPNVHPSV